MPVCDRCVSPGAHSYSSSSSQQAMLVIMSCGKKRPFTETTTKYISTTILSEDIYVNIRTRTVGKNIIILYYEAPYLLCHTFFYPPRSLHI